MKPFFPAGRSQIPSSLISLGRHFVYMEGTVSEKNYIINIRDRIASKNRCQPNDVLLFPVKKKHGKHTNDLIDFAIDDVKAKCNAGNKPDCVWIFFDKDSFCDFDEALKRIVSLNNPKKHNALNFSCDDAEIAWIPCWSNECLEVWYYFYFANLQSALHREDYLPKINALLKDNPKKEKMTKNTSNPHDFLVNHGGNMALAIRYAKKKDCVSSLKKPNPSTGIYRFAEMMSPYFD
jgi:hypothetical protein